MSIQDNTELMLREYLIDNYGILSCEFRISYVTKECSWEVKAYYALSSEKLLDITINATDISLWLWERTQK
jgi:hypothetical protein